MVFTRTYGRRAALIDGRVLCICGPTASGKSALADQVALILGTDVISVDAMQVYRGMDIGTAKTPVAERKVALQMVDVADISTKYSVALYQRDARKLVDERLDAQGVAVLCGGTGLYMDAIIDEMDFPSGEEGSAARSRYYTFLEEQGAEALWSLLNERNQAAAALIHPNNSKRVIRALEMEDEGVDYAAQVAALHERNSHYNAELWGLTMSRERLYERINKRVDLMFDEGLVTEVQELCERGLADSLTALQAIGYKEVLQALNGEITLDEARELIKQNSRRYAKRQMSWLKRDGRVHWLDMDVLSLEEAVAQVIAGVCNATV